MEIQEQFSKVALELKAQAEFLGTQIVVYESTEPGRERLRELVETVKQAAALLEEHPPGEAPAVAAVEKAAAPAAGEAPEEVERPEDADDLDGWLAFQLQNPEDEDARENVERLVKIAEENGEWERVVDVYLMRLELTEETAARVTLLKEVARIYEQEIGDLGKAFSAAIAAGQEDPGNEAIANEMERYAEATEQWSDLVAALNEIAPAVKDGLLSAKIWLKLGRIYNERLDRPDYAVSSLWHALEGDPTLAEAWDDLAGIYNQKEQWDDLVHVLRKRLDATEKKQDRIFFLMELADLYETRKNDLTEARLMYDEVLTIDPDHGDAAASLEAVLRRLELWEPLVAILLKRVDQADSEERARGSLLEVSNLLWKQLEDPTAAVPHFEKLLEQQPDDTEVLKALYEIYEELGRLHDFLRVAERRSELTEDVKERIRICRRAAGEMMADKALRPKAADALEKIVELDPTAEEIYRDLEGLYIREAAWDELVTTYRRHANIAESVSVKCEVLRAMAAVLDEKLGDPTAAVDALHEALQHDDEDLQAMVFLSTLLEAAEEWVELVDVLSKRAELTTEEADRVDLHRRIGEVTLEKLGNQEEAEQRLMKALELDPENLGAMMALVTLYKERKEWLRAANMLSDAERACGNRLEKARLLFEAGEIYRLQVEDPEKAVNMYAKAMLVDPEHEQAAMVLAEHYFAREAWEDAEPLLDMLLRKTDDKKRKIRLHLHTMLGLTAKRLKKADKAITNLEIARDMDPTSLQVLQELANLKFHMEAWKDAANLFQAVLVAHRDAITPEELVKVYHRLGSVKMELGEKDKALNLFEKALDVDATYEPSVQAVLLLREEGGDYDRIVATKLTLLDRAQTDGDRHRLSVEIGDLYSSKLDDPDKALTFYERASALKADDRGVLHKMLEIHTQREAWDQGVEIVLELADLEEKGQLKAKYLYTSALVYRDELKDGDRALEQLERCLESDSSFKSAFDAIDRLLTEREDWNELARALRRQFKRQPESTPAEQRIALLDRLGSIYSDRLGEVDTAVAALEAADQLDVENAERKSKLVQLYLKAGPDKVDKAIEQHHALLRQSPYKIQLYKDLTELYIRTQQKDRTWCMCAALSFLKKASEKEQLFYDRYRPKELVLAQRSLTDQHWRDLIRHPAESARIDAIFAGVAQQVALQNARPHKKFGLKRGEKLNADDDSRAVFRMFVYASRVLAVQPRPEVFVRGDQPQPIQVANATEKGSLLPTWLVDAEKFEGRSQREALFEVTRQLAHMRPERYLWRALVSQADLFNVIYAAVSIMIPKAPVPSDSPDVKKLSLYLKKVVPPMVFEQLLPTAKELLSAGKEEANLANWIVATQRTALRAALVLTNDFETVAKVVATEADSITGLPAKERVADLLQFSVSREYFELRNHLGFAMK
ncbi:MAG: tetratricopeptide repeat protein [bacterium]